jgi:uncharacterized protein
MQHYLITGGTGLIGSALCKHLIAQDHEVTVLSRTPEKVTSKCGHRVKGVQDLTEISADTQIDIVINLAGAPIADRRWTKKRKAVLEMSRIELTHNLVGWLIHRQKKPECLISGSAVGWYGDGGNSILTEQSSYHDEYTHQLCDTWEKEALRAEQSGIRVCLVRTGLVLASKGGFLQKMLLPFKLGLGGRLGDGQQFMSWIHISDMVNFLEFMTTNVQLKGVFNACSPSPITNKIFTQKLAQQLHRPAFLPLPSWILKIILGEMSCLLLKGQRALPKKAQTTGFQFHYTDLNLALANILSR